MLFEPTVEALGLLKKRYRTRLIIGSGRRLDFLLNKLRVLQLIDAFVAENSAVLHFTDASVTLTLCGCVAGKVSLSFFSSCALSAR